MESTENSQLADINRDITETYDKQVYTSNAFPFSSPGHLRAAAHLYGLETVPLENARVLELGCAAGGNLLPFAVAYPNAKVVGVDLSSVQVEQGKQLITAMGLKNLELHAMSLTDITPDFGQFDYIISHGVFSWVPPEVREAMMRIARDNLSPLGIAYISYNTYPGWKAGDIVRDAMLLHSHNAQTDEDKLAAAKAMLNLLSEGIAASNPLAPSLKGAVAQLRKHSDYYIAHEYLEIFNNPCYLLEFVNLADQYGLAHVGDAEPHTEMSVTYGQNVQLNHSLIAMGQPREMRQQYLDFAVGRNFRKSLLVSKDRADQILTSPSTERLADLRWAGFYTEHQPAENEPKDKRCFRNYKNTPLYTRDTNVVAVVETLSKAWPASLSFKELLEKTTEAAQQTDQASAEKQLLSTLETLFRLNSLRYTLERSSYDAETEVANKAPVLIPGAAHLLAKTEVDSTPIGGYNLWHDTVRVQLQDAERQVVKNIDGTRTRKQLATLLRDALHEGTVPNTDGKLLKGQRNLDATAEKIVQKLLDLLRRQGLLGKA